MEYLSGAGYDCSHKTNDIEEQLKRSSIAGVDEEEGGYRWREDITGRVE